MSITYESVLKYLEKINTPLEAALNELDKHIISGCDKQNIPIYFTKYRIKSADSIYLKTKRAAVQDLNTIRDYAGYRILCLFEQSILDIHKFLLENLPRVGYPVNLCKIYNWESPNDKASVTNLVEVLKTLHPSVECKVSSKKSGYKSIHYDVSYNRGGYEYSIEIQLRTLLQDVWGELDHALSYKQGSIHPHIKESFRLLARDLETNDALVRHLNRISDRERCYDTFSARSSVTPYYFGTEDNDLPDLLRTGRLAKSYSNYVENRKNAPDLKKWATNATDSFKEIAGKITNEEYETDPKVKYWLNMEKLYFQFLNGQIEEVLKGYKSISHDFENSYVVHFRLGEIEFMLGNHVASLVEFDKTEELLATNQSANYYNVYIVKTKIAIIYWLLGDEYFDIALQKIKEANVICEKHPHLFDQTNRRKLYNNLCWYHLENYVVAEEKGDIKIAGYHFDEAESAYEQLTEILKDESENAPSNDYDTIAWFCYQAYRRTKNRVFLNKAQKYCWKIWTSENAATFKLTSFNLHRNHIQEIMSAGEINY